MKRVSSRSRRPPKNLRSTSSAARSSPRPNGRPSSSAVSDRGRAGSSAVKARNTDESTRRKLPAGVVFPETTDEVVAVRGTLHRVVDSRGYAASDFHVHSIYSPDSRVPAEERVVRTRRGRLPVLEQLEIPFVARARLLYEAVRGIDPSPVLPVGQKPPQVIADHEFGTDTNDVHTLESVLYRLVEQAGIRLRRHRRAARRIAIVLDYSDGMRRARQAAARPATANDLTLFEVARRALHLAWIRRVRIRHLRLICDRLVFPPAQLALFAADRKADQKRSELVNAVDSVRRRFGPESIRMGSILTAEH